MHLLENLTMGLYAYLFYFSIKKITFQLTHTLSKNKLVTITTMQPSNIFTEEKPFFSVREKISKT